jgi:excisionase family DNA binding protein
MKNKKIENVSENLLSEVEAAAYLKMSYSKLRLSIRPKNEIAFHRFGSSIRYSVEDLKIYVLKNRVEAVN